MLLTVERVSFLKSVDLFTDTPDHILASVAAIIREMHLDPGTLFIREGDLGDCMYIVVDGQVQVHKGDRSIIELGPGSSVGELAVLDPEPRAASVRAMSEVLLFRIDKQPFDEVMADRPEIARSVIRALCERIREQGRTIAGAASGQGPTGSTVE
jgi:CRP/FNR family transcriptional regulator, cyclic AMP receptor protein